MAIEKPKAPKSPVPSRPTAAPGVPVPQAYTGPSRNLRNVAIQIGRDRALAEFYKSLVGEQREYDNDYRQSYFDGLRDTNRYQQEIAIQNNREWLKTGEDGRGIAAPIDYESLGVDNPSRTEQVASELEQKASGSKTGFEPFAGSQQGATINDKPALATSQVAEIMRMAKASDDPEATYAALMKQASSNAGATPKSPTQAKAEKDAERDEQESNWWDGVKNRVDEGWNGKYGAGTVLDAITPDAVTDRLGEGAKEWVASPVGNAVKDAGSWGIKQLSRTSHATASAAMAWNEMDDDPGTNGIGKWLGMGMFGGQGIAESFDDLNWEGLKNVGSEFWEGLSLKNDTTFSDVIRRNAEFNPEKTYHDNFNYQMIMGIGQDIVFDPLNLVGVGIISKPLKAASELSKASKLDSVVKEAAEVGIPRRGKTIFQHDLPDNYTAEELADMLGGSRKYSTRAEAIAGTKDIQRNAEYIRGHVNKVADNISGKSNNRLQAIEKQAARISKQLEAQKNAHGAEVVSERVEARTARQEAAGIAPEGSTVSLATRVEQHQVASALKWDSSHVGKDATWKRLNFESKMGEGWKNHPALSESDRKWLWDNNERLVRQEHPEVAAKHSTLVSNYRSAKTSLAAAKKAGTDVAPAQARFNKARLALANHNKAYDAARADVFMRSARARVNANLKTGPLELRVKTLQKLIQESRFKLEQLNITPFAWGQKGPDGKEIKFDLEHRASTDTEIASTVSHNGDRSLITEDDVRSWPKPNTEGLDTAFSPNLKGDHESRGFSSLGDQYQAVHMAAMEELENINKIKGLQVVGKHELDGPLMEIPDELLDTNSPFADAIDRHKIAAALDFDEDTLTFSLKQDKPQSGPTAEWLRDFADMATMEAQEKLSRLSQNAQRAANEEALGNVKGAISMELIGKEAKKGNFTAEQFIKMFSTPDGKPIVSMTESAAKQMRPSFEYKGKTYTQNGKGLKNLVDAPVRSRLKKIKRLLANPEKWTEADANYMRELFKEFGLPVGNHPQAAYEYATKHYKRYEVGIREHAQGDLNAVGGRTFDEFDSGTGSSMDVLFSPEALAFAQKFKKVHGIKLNDALTVRDKVLGYTVKSAYEDSQWARNFPDGMPRREFVERLTSASTSLDVLKVLDGGPFRVNVKEADLGRPSPVTRPLSASKDKFGDNHGWKYLFEQEKVETLSKGLRAKGARANLEKALEKAGLDKGTDLDELRQAWGDDMIEFFDSVEPTKLQNKLKGIWKSSYDKQAPARKADIAERTAKVREPAAAKVRKENIEKARKGALADVTERIENGQQLNKSKVGIDLPHQLDEVKQAESVAAVKKQEVIEQMDEAKADLQEAKDAHDNIEVARLEKRLASLRAGWNREKAALTEDVKAAKQSKKDLAKLIREEAILQVAHAQKIATTRGLSFNVVSKQIPIPGTASMFRAAEKAGSLPVLNRFAEVYRNAFASQAKLLPDEMVYIRNRAISDPSKNIGELVRNLKGGLGQHSMDARRTAWDSYVKSGPKGKKKMLDEPLVSQQIHHELKRMLPYFQAKVPVGPDTLKTWEINKYLPAGHKLPSSADIKSPQELAKLLSRGTNDPLEAVWNTRIAIEKAMARKAMVHSLNETFGIKRGYKLNKNGAPVKSTGDESAKVIEKLGKEGWETVGDLGHGYYFHPDVAESIKRLLTMFEPENAGKIAKTHDEIIGIWKTSVTIYNIPGYYIRNGMGEVMSAWLGGVNSAKPYYKAAQVMRYARDETKHARALAELKPELGLKVESQKSIGSKHVVTLKNGDVIDAARAHDLYREHGLSTGFVNTEYRHHYSKAKENLRRVPGVKAVGRGNEGLREFAEDYEDFFRMGHFIDKLGKAPKGMSEFKAAEWAAKEVRKYHFDYTDFTKAEKTVMLRAFPFYKWTRKALPLMSSMMFVKPGKMMAYPKAMEGLSEGLVNSDDLSADDGHNGFMPNYMGIVPSTIADMWSYQVGGETGYDAQGDQSYLRMSTPQMDSLNGLSNPVNLAESLMNPLAKAAWEQGTGETLSMGLPIANEDGIVDGKQVDNDNPSPDDKGFLNNRTAHLLSMIPPGAILSNYERGDLDSDALIRLLTGMGYREVSEQHRNMLKGQGEK